MRQAFAQLVIPAAVAVVWYAAHVRSGASQMPLGTWREGSATVTGNPYGVSLSWVARAQLAPGDGATDNNVNADQSPQAVGDLSTPDDARR